MWCFKRFKKSRQPSQRPALGIPAYIPAGPLELGTTVDPDASPENVNNGGGPQTTLVKENEDGRFYAAGASTWTPERENDIEALQEWGREHGVSSDTPKEQLGQNFPSLHPDPRGLAGQNLEEYGNQGTLAERPPGAVPKYIFDMDQFGEGAQHGTRFMRSWVPEGARKGTTELVSDDDQLGEDAQHAVQSTPAPPVKIAVMGATGSGKTTFINLASGSNLRIGTGSEPCTVDVQLADEFTLSGRAVTLIDTPGFDDASKTDTGILNKIGSFLADMYKEGSALAGVIYVHRISDNQFEGITGWNFNMFRKICGESALGNAFIVTNMWEVDSQDINEAREKELTGQFFGPAFDKGTQMVRHRNTVQSAQDIVWTVMKNRPVALQIQQELVDERMDIIDTAAGDSVNQEKKWDAFRLTGDPQDILTFLAHRFDLAVGGNKNQDEAIQNALRALAYAPGHIAIEARELFDPTEPSFARGICYVFQGDKPIQLRKAAFFFLPRVSGRWFNAPDPIIEPDQMKSFCIDWASTMDELENTDDVERTANMVLFGMIDSPDWCPHIVALLESLTLIPDDSQLLRKCLDNPDLMDAIKNTGNAAATAVWLKILWLKYGELVPGVQRRLEAATKGIAQGRRRTDLDGCSSAVESELRKAEYALTGFYTFSQDPTVTALRKKIVNLERAKNTLANLKRG